MLKYIISHINNAKIRRETQKREAESRAAKEAHDKKISDFRKQVEIYAMHQTWLTGKELSGHRVIKGGKSSVAQISDNEIEEIASAQNFDGLCRQARIVSTENFNIENFKKDSENTLDYIDTPHSGIYIRFKATELAANTRFYALAAILLNNIGELRDEETHIKTRKNYDFLMIHLLALNGGRLEKYYNLKSQDSPGAYTFEYHRFMIRMKALEEELANEYGAGEGSRAGIHSFVKYFITNNPTHRLTEKLINLDAYRVDWSTP